MKNDQKVSQLYLRQFTVSDTIAINTSFSAIAFHCEGFRLEMINCVVSLRNWIVLCEMIIRVSNEISSIDRVVASLLNAVENWLPWSVDFSTVDTCTFTRLNFVHFIICCMWICVKVPTWFNIYPIIWCFLMKIISFFFFFALLFHQMTFTLVYRHNIPKTAPEDHDVT